MPFREKAKNLFRSKYHERAPSNASNTYSTDSSRDRLPSDIYYKPHEVPPPKYRRPAAKEHKDKLEAFSFSEAWRKKSFQSNRSPMGTRASSRRNSAFSLGRKSRKSIAAGESRSNSVASASTAKSTKLHDDVGEPMRPTLTTQTEEEGDGDVGNVGISRYVSREKPQANGPSNGLHKMNTAYDHQAFSEEDFAQAMRRSNLEVSAQS